MTKRAILYARVSRDDTRQEGRNLAGQLDMCREHAVRRGYSIVAEMSEDDKGASGAVINLPRLNEVREMAKGRQFDVLIVREIDRLSRSLAKQLIVEQELQHHRVEIEYVLGEYPDTPEGTLLRHIRATVAEYEREKINERVVRGRYSKVKSGSVLVSGRPPYGYRTERDGQKVSLILDEQEAAIVREVFAWYLEGLSSRKIAEKLSTMGVPTCADTRPELQGKKVKQQAIGIWSRAMIAKIIKTETYSGTWYYGKTIGRQGSARRPKEQQVAVAVPPLVSMETWRAAQEIRGYNRTQKRHESSYGYLLKSRIVCGECGYKMNGKTAHVGGKLYAYYHCVAGQQERIRKCSSKVYYPAAVADRAVWNWLRSLLLEPDKLQIGLTAYQAERESQVAPLRTRLKQINESVSGEKEKLGRILDLYLAGDFSKELLDSRKAQLESYLRTLEAEKYTIETALAEQAVTQEDVEWLQQFGAQIASQLDAVTDSIDAMRNILRILHLDVTLASEDGHKIAHVRCGLGGDSFAPLHTATSGRR